MKCDPFMFIFHLYCPFLSILIFVWSVFFCVQKVLFSSCEFDSMFWFVGKYKKNRFQIEQIYLLFISSVFHAKKNDFIVDISSDSLFEYNLYSINLSDPFHM